MTSTIEDDVTLVNTGYIIDRCPLINDMDKSLCHFECVTYSGL